MRPWCSGCGRLEFKGKVSMSDLLPRLKDQGYGAEPERRAEIRREQLWPLGETDARATPTRRGPLQIRFRSPRRHLQTVRFRE